MQNGAILLIKCLDLNHKHSKYSQEKKTQLHLLAAVRIDAREHGTWIKVPKGHAKKLGASPPLNQS